MALPIFFSASLYYFTYPNLFFLKGLWPFAWLFLVPFFMTLEQKDAGDRLKSGILFGLLCNLCVVNWMIPYSLPGYFLLVISLSLQQVVFALFYVPPEKLKGFGLYYVPALWVICESIRKYVMMGESWDLGHSQVFNLTVLPSARLFGSQGISFLIVLVNYAIYRIFFAERGCRMSAGVLGGALALVAIACGIGTIVGVFENNGATQNFKIGLLQPCTDFRGELTDERIERILDENIALTRAALKTASPDLMVWPETSIPKDFLTDESQKKKFLALVREAGIPFLIGMVTSDGQSPRNSAVFFDENGRVRNVYHKRRLVPLTEYVPPVWYWKWFTDVWRIDSPGLVPGTGPVLMEIPSKKTGGRAIFGVVICSEDNVGEVFREYARTGAEFDIVLLNNGWFSQKEGLVMHAQHSIMHAVENSVPVVRAGNSGLSCLIDRQGRLPSFSFASLEQKSFSFVDVAVSPRLKAFDNLADIFCVFCGCFVILFWFMLFMKRPLL